MRAAYAAGRWSCVSPPGEVEDHDELAEAVADQLLQRWGVLFCDLGAHEKLALPWRALQWALRRLEDRGLIKGGRFVKGFGGGNSPCRRRSRASRWFVELLVAVGAWLSAALIPSISRASSCWENACRLVGPNLLR